MKICLVRNDKMGDMILTLPVVQGLKDINLDIYNGEILGIAGISGNGQNELMETLIGEYKLEKDNVLLLDNEDISNYSPDKRRKVGISFIPEERIGHSAIPVSYTHLTLPTKA